MCCTSECQYRQHLKIRFAVFKCKPFLCMHESGSPLMHIYALQIATPVQAARADHLCFPHLPDVLAMCTGLAHDVSDESFRSKRPKLDPKSAQDAGEQFAWTSLLFAL